MGRRLTHSLGDEFEQRTLFLWAALGMISHLGRFGRVVTSTHRARTARRGAAADADVALHAMLGLVSLSRTARAHWRVLEQPTPPIRRRRVRRPEMERPRALLV